MADRWESVCLQNQTLRDTRKHSDRHVGLSPTEHPLPPPGSAAGSRVTLPRVGFGPAAYFSLGLWKIHGTTHTSVTAPCATLCLKFVVFLL